MSKPFLLTLEYPPQHGGVAKYLEGEVKASPVPVIVSHVQSEKWPQATHSFSGGWMKLIWSERKKYKGCDGLWISHVLPMGYIALVWKWIYRIPYRVYLHGLDLVLPRKSKWKSFWVKIILNNADEIIVNSNATEKLLDYYKINSGRDAPQWRGVSIKHPRIEKIDTTKYTAKGQELRDKYNIADKPILLSISRLVKRKGIDLVIKSLPQVWKQIPDLIYVVVGEGEEKEHLIDVAVGVKEPPPTPSLVKEGEQKPHPRLYPGGGRGVVFTGTVSEEEKYGWLSTCNCFILTPIDDPNDFEGYGIVYKEAQMFGKPVIGSRVGGVPEAVGEDGVLVEPGNIEQIANAIIKYVQS